MECEGGRSGVNEYAVECTTMDGDGQHTSDGGGPYLNYAQRSFSMASESPSTLLAAEAGHERRTNLLKLWIQYWNAWEHDELPEGMWWNRDVIERLASPDIILLKPEGIFKGKDMILEEYENFSSRMGKNHRMTRRLANVLIDESKDVITAVYDVILPQGVLTDDAESKEEMPKVNQSEVLEHVVYSVSEVLRWDLERELILEIHYYGQGLRLIPSNLKCNMFDRAHRNRCGSLEETSELSMSMGIGLEDVIMKTDKVNDDRILATLSMKFINALLACNEGVVLSLASKDYKHRSTLGEANVFEGIRAHQADCQFGGEIKGEIHSIQVDEKQNIVSIERNYEVGEQMSEVIDVLYWNEEGPQISRHHSYGFSWQTSKDPGEGDEIVQLQRCASSKSEDKAIGFSRTYSMSSKRSRSDLDSCDEDHYQSYANFSGKRSKVSFI